MSGATGGRTVLQNLMRAIEREDLKRQEKIREMNLREAKGRSSKEA